MGQNQMTSASQAAGGHPLQQNSMQQCLEKSELCRGSHIPQRQHMVPGSTRMYQVLYYVQASIINLLFSNVHHLLKYLLLDEVSLAWSQPKQWSLSTISSSFQFGKKWEKTHDCGQPLQTDTQWEVADGKVRVSSLTCQTQSNWKLHCSKPDAQLLSPVQLWSLCRYFREILFLHILSTTQLWKYLEQATKAA